jgi:hypothetical protein
MTDARARSIQEDEKDEEDEIEEGRTRGGQGEGGDTDEGHETEEGETQEGVQTERRKLMFTARRSDLPLALLRQPCLRRDSPISLPQDSRTPQIRSQMNLCPAVNFDFEDPRFREALRTVDAWFLLRQLLNPLALCLLPY